MCYFSAALFKTYLRNFSELKKGNFPLVTDSARGSNKFSIKFFLIVLAEQKEANYLMMKKIR